METQLGSSHRKIYKILISLPNLWRVRFVLKIFILCLKMFSFYLFGKCPIKTWKNHRSLLWENLGRAINDSASEVADSWKRNTDKSKNFSLPNSLIFLFRRTGFKTFQHRNKPLFFFFPCSEVWICIMAAEKKDSMNVILCFSKSKTQVLFIVWLDMWWPHNDSYIFSIPIH